MQASIDAEKPLILVHEADEAKGGAALTAMQDECREETEKALVAEGREDCANVFQHLFGGRWSVVTWARVRAFQLTSLRLIAEQVLRHSLTYKKVRTPTNEREKQKEACTSRCRGGEGSASLRAETRVPPESGPASKHNQSAPPQDTPWRESSTTDASPSAGLDGVLPECRTCSTLHCSSASK